MDGNDNKHNSDICSIFGGNAVNNIVKIRCLIDFKEVCGNPEWISV